MLQVRQQLTGKISVSGNIARVLMDSGSTHSYISKKFLLQTALKLDVLDFYLFVTDRKSVV